MPKIFSTSSAARFLNRDAAVAVLKERADSLAARDPNVESVVLFGSLARGDASARSDADLLIILQSGEGRWLDRVPSYGQAFESLDLDVDVFPVTRQEWRQGLDSGTGFARSIQDRHILLYGQRL